LTTAITIICLLFILSCEDEKDEPNPKIELVKGDATVTIPKFIKDNPHIIISLLFLDFDLYEPTKAAIDYLVPRMPKGGVLVFDEINNESWPGETVAMLEKFKISNYKISRFNFDPNISYIVL